MEDYYNVGTREKPVISNSSLSYLNPLEGGSPKKFLSFFDKVEEEKKNAAFNKGSLIHKYQESPSEFIISDVEAPSGMMGEMCTKLSQLIVASTKFPVILSDITITSALKKEATASAEIIEISNLYDTLATSLNIGRDVFIHLFREARRSGSYYKSYGELTLLETFKTTGLAYVKFLLKAENKIALTAAEKYAIENAIKAIEENKAAQDLLVGSFDDKIFKELEIYFVVDDIPMKAKLDHLKLNYQNRTVSYTDTKTTSKSAYMFYESYIKYRYNRQHKFYEIAILWYMKNILRIEDADTWSFRFYNVVVELHDLFHCVVYETGPYDLLAAETEIQSLIGRYKYHLSKGVWNMSMEEGLNNGIIFTSNIV
jgi:hypothetical protein